MPDTAPTLHTARCACGALQLDVRGPLPPPSWCHCDQCRLRTGSLFGAQLAVPADRTRIRGGSATWSRVGDGGATVVFHRCETCGSTVWWELSVFPGRLSVAAGAFGRDLPPAPRGTVYDERRPTWLHLPDSVVDIID
jgi:hypothetical protein